ncbi:hypothetical protein ANMWB30_13060 [Arthrobacter sp. MWB30]|nr:hypothetical protein ANMWB30_13060 [Arthrobacter sp. MWB30]
MLRNSHIDSSPGRSPGLMVKRLGRKAGRGLPCNWCDVPLHILASPISGRFCLLMGLT